MADILLYHHADDMIYLCGSFLRVTIAVFLCALLGSYAFISIS